MRRTARSPGRLVISEETASRHIPDPSTADLDLGPSRMSLTDRESPVYGRSRHIPSRAVAPADRSRRNGDGAASRRETPPKRCHPFASHDASFTRTHALTTSSTIGSRPGSAPPEGCARRGGHALEQARVTWIHRSATTASTARRTEALPVCVTEATHSVSSAVPLPEGHGRMEVAPDTRPKVSSAAGRSATASDGFSCRQPNLRPRPHSRAGHDVQARTSRDVHLCRRRARRWRETGSHQGIKDAFLRFEAFQRSESWRSLRVGLPHRHHPFSGFLTLSTVLSRRDLVALFRATSAHRLSTFRAFSAQTSRGASRHSLLSCHRTAMTSSEPDANAFHTPLAVASHGHMVCPTPPPWLQSFAPTGRSSLRTAGKRHTKPLLSWPSPSPR